MNKRKFFGLFISSLFLVSCAHLNDSLTKQARKEDQQRKQQERFTWWPTDALPAPVKDEQSGGYWWWPTTPGEARPWGNRGFVYVYKIIYDYQGQDEAAAENGQTIAQGEMRPSLLVKRIIKNVKIYFDYNKADLRDDHTVILTNAIKTLNRNPQADILITGNCDARGSVEYNMKLGLKRGESVKQYLIANGIPEEKIKIVSRGKLDAIALIQDLLGMQKDRNAQFMIAEVEEIMLPSGRVPPELKAQQVDENRYEAEQRETVESSPRVSARDYTVQEGDSLWTIAKRELGNGNRWEYLYELNKDRVKNPNKLKPGTVIIIPVE